MSFFQEVDVGVDVFIVGTAASERMAVVVEDDIERLGIGTELGTLEPAPLRPEGSLSGVLSST